MSVLNIINAIKTKSFIEIIFLFLCFPVYNNVCSKHYQRHKNEVSQGNQRLYLSKLSPTNWIF